ncbi:MBL fold metallo-hydrolase [Sphingobium subterraneum]|uniref:L-ascorbate metabolism protein UlaG (Beta-lactamase superfamily) n=1 Tax=Sphingobium subterraneum TaxID=627688 RepID=A0A841J6U3_9SPHN|nr:MBL fold metallo-hydrolase [Sphingobium subterraneum]MBB6123921.1 L-ascorbate metabolism protein UlaG (beta-lactamase superfamily) [Sphingobium subterraneum]
MLRAAGWLGAAILWIVIALALAATLVPAFLDRIYYEGPHSGHFDGARFANPDGDIGFPVPPGAPRGNMLTRWLWVNLDRPPWPDHVDVRPTKPPARVTGSAMRATWVGHATVLVQAGGLNILTDPIWSDYASPLPGVGPKRVAQPGIAFAALPKIDIVVVSHNHYDHLDIPTLKRLWDRDRPLIVTALGNGKLLRDAGIGAREGDWGAQVDRPGAKVHILRNHHWSSRWGKDRNRALWSSFLIETGAGNVYFAGDTGAGDMRWPLEARRFGPIRLAIIPIGAFRFYPGQMDSEAHIGPRHAVQVFEALGASTALPIHWGTFRQTYEARDTPPEMLRLHLRCAGIAPNRFAPLAIGAAMNVPPYSFVRPGKQDAAACADRSPEMMRLR